MTLSEHSRDALVEALFAEFLELLPSLPHRPGSTYRLQLNKDFGFAAATAVVPYLHRLGVTDVYCSPYLKAVPGSGHGYDVVDHKVLNPELGTPEQHQAFVDALAKHGMTHLLDYVPNHMAIGAANPYWMDVLENGPSSIHAPLFDIDWKPVKDELENRVLVPVLGDQYGTVLERGELVLHFDAGAFFLTYYADRYPITPRQYPQILRHRLPELEKKLGAESVELMDLLSIINACEKLPPRSETDPARIVERNREKEVIKRRLTAICEQSAAIRAFIEEDVRLFNGAAGEPRSFDLLDGLLREQAYRLAYWRVAAEEINYRRFFDVNTLAAIRMEDPRVMKEAHALVFGLIRDGKLAGLRIDHPDGLNGPADYFDRLQEAFAAAITERLFRERVAKNPSLLAGAPGEAPRPLEEVWAELEPRLRERFNAEAKRRGQVLKPLYVVVEKILGCGEQMPSRWAVHGTTGYDFLNLVNGLFVDPAKEKEIDELFTRFTGERLDYQELVYQKKRQIMADSLSSELNVLSRQLNRISELDRRTRDFTLNSLKRALVELVAHFPVYRTYVNAEGDAPGPTDVAVVERVVARAKRRNPTVNGSIFDFIRDVLLLRCDASVSQEARAARLAFVLKLQQVTAPVMAKSVEDTAFYVYNRLVSLNEVGGEPQVFGVTPEVFHRESLERQKSWPGSLLATSTHDTKRSEDVRARIDALSELSGEWRRMVAAWSRLNRRHKTEVHDRLAPDRSEELLLYQTLLGAWPFGTVDAAARDALRTRLQAYLQKALKEAKVNTSWVNPDEAWDRAVSGFVEALLDPRKSSRFLMMFERFQQRVERIGALNSVSQLALKLASPGVPDLYQGTELWDLSLVDPDNRRPVDFARRDALLATLEESGDRAALCRELVQGYPDGRLKLLVAHEGLKLRRAMRRFFADADYVALPLEGQRQGNAIAFARRLGEEAVITIAPRLVAALEERDLSLSGEETWGETFVEVPFATPGEQLVDVFTRRTHEVQSVDGKAGFHLKTLFNGFPVVMLAPPEHVEPQREDRDRQRSTPPGEELEPAPF